LRKEVQRIEEMDNINDWEGLDKATNAMVTVQKEF
jgi:hypothetical protein